MDETKFLGVIFDRRLSFVPHLKYVKKKALKALNILKVVGNTEWGADRKVMLHPELVLIFFKDYEFYFIYCTALYTVFFNTFHF